MLIKGCNIDNLLDIIDEQGNCLDILFDDSQRQVILISAFSLDHEMGQPYQLVYYEKSSLEHTIDQLVILFYP